MTTRVVIVDDDGWIRRGRAQALGEVPGIQVAAALSHQEALSRPDLWPVSDVVLVDAWDGRAGFDRFPGVGVVRAIRAHGSGGDPRVVVVTGHLVNDLLRLRMAEAGADFFYSHEEVADPERLAAAVASAAAAPPAVRPTSRPGAVEPALDWIRTNGLEDAFSATSQKAVPFSRRTIGHIRREVGDRAGLAPRGQLSRWRAVVDFVNRARGAELRRPAGTDVGRPPPRPAP